MDPKLKKRIFDILWAAAAAACTAFLATLVPSVKELLGEQLSHSAGPFIGALTILLRNA